MPCPDDEVQAGTGCLHKNSPSVVAQRLTQP